ncbi:MAG: cytochrome c biogenesis protein ResB, partial [Myxococcales bacterium]
TWQRTPDAQPKQTRIRVNHPLNIDGTDVYLIGHGYAPHITVRDSSGEVAYSGPTIFLPEDTSFRSFGTIKVPDASGDIDLGFEGELYPTYATSGGMPFSAYPEATDPLVSLEVFKGDLGMDDGVPQSVYALDKSGLDKLMEPGGTKPFRTNMGLGQTVELPDGLGTITFDSMEKFVKLQISRSPADWLALLGVVLALLGLMASLFIRPRRIWVRTRVEGGRTLTEIAGLDRSSGGDLGADLDELISTLSHEEKDQT